MDQLRVVFNGSQETKVQTQRLFSCWPGTFKVDLDGSQHCLGGWP